MASKRHRSIERQQCLARNRGQSTVGERENNSVGDERVDAETVDDPAWNEADRVPEKSKR